MGIIIYKHSKLSLEEHLTNGSSYGKEVRVNKYIIRIQVEAGLNLFRK